MTRRPQILREMKPLLVALTDGGLNQEECEQCITMLRSSEEAREVYFDFVMMHTKLFAVNASSIQTIGADDVVPDEHPDGVADVGEVAAGSSSAPAGKSALDVNPSHIEEMLEELSKIANAGLDADEAVSELDVDEGLPKKKRRKKWDAVLPPDSTPMTMLDVPLPWVIGIAAVIAVVAAFLVLPSPEPAELPVVATLTRSLSAEWTDASVPTEPGQPLRQGKKVLVAGRVWITFDSGARVGVAAPATFTLEDSGRMRLMHGKVVAYCSEKARGFVVNTLATSIVDLGTEFGIAVDASGLTDIQVLTGKVAVRPPMAKNSSLVTFEMYSGDARQIDATGKVTDIEFAISDFGILRPLLDRNLIINGDFEMGEPTLLARNAEGGLYLSDTTISGWIDQTGATTINYDQPLLRDQAPGNNGFPNPDYDHVPSNRGHCYYIGYEEGTTSQQIDVSALAQQIKKGQVKFELSGWIGGIIDQDDVITVKATALDESDLPLKSSQIGPILARERDNKTGLWHHFVRGKLPVGTRSVLIELISQVDPIHSGDPDYRPDAYADNLMFTLSKKESTHGAPLEEK